MIKWALGVVLVLVIVGVVIDQRAAQPAPTSSALASRVFHLMRDRTIRGRVDLVSGVVVVIADAEPCAQLESMVRELGAEAPPRQIVRCETERGAVVWEIEQLAGAFIARGRQP